MIMLREIVVSGYLLRRSLAGFPRFEKKKTKKQTKKEKKTSKTYINTSDGAQNLVIFLIILQYLNI